MDERRGQVKATLVGHRVALRDGGERLNPANWIALCVSCNTKQAHDDRAYGIANTTPGGGREKTSPQTRKTAAQADFCAYEMGFFNCP
jgi:5-methylcytosine-specific restriction endonuclease McrA